MSSAWGKFLAQVTVPTGGWTLDWTAAAGVTIATVPAGTYATVLHLCEALEDALVALGGAHVTDTVTVSASGIVTITIDGITGVVWATTDDDLETALGLAGTEAPVGDVLTGTLIHAHAWYPGILSYGATRGEGITADDNPQPADDMIRQYSGSGVAQLVAPARRHYLRPLRFGLIRKAEAWHKQKGPVCLMDRWATLPLYWYPDRDIGEVGSYGTQIDPGAPYYEGDDDGDYHVVTVAEKPRIERNPSHPDWYSVEVVMAIAGK